MTIRPLILAAALLGCAPRPADHFDLYVSEDVPCDWVQTAASGWQARVPVTFDVHCALAACTEDCWSISAATTGSLSASSPDSTRGDTVETGSPNRGYILVTVDEHADPVQMVALITHELGHAMSLKHLSDTAHPVMAADLGWWRVTCADVAEYFQVRGEPVPACEDPACPPQAPGCPASSEGP